MENNRPSNIQIMRSAINEWRPKKRKFRLSVGSKYVQKLEIYGEGSLHLVSLKIIDCGFVDIVYLGS